MAYEFVSYSQFPHSISGHPLDMNNGLGAFDPQIPPHMYDMTIPPQALSASGTSNGSSSSLHGGERTETKPRLAKEEVARLEKIFLANHKPNSNVKKGLADEMGVDVARINNWFQNRRAKAKQEKKQDEFEQAQRRQNQNRSSSQDEESLRTQVEWNDSEEQSHGSFSSASGPPTAVAMIPRYADPSAASLASFDRSMEVAQAAVQQGAFGNEHADPVPTPRMSFPENCQEDGNDVDRARFPSSEELDMSSSDWTDNHVDFRNPFLLPPHPVQFQSEIEPPMDQGPLYTEFLDNSEANDGVSPLSNNSSNTLLPSQLLSPLPNQTNAQAHEDFLRHFEQPEFSKPEATGEAQYQPQPDGLRFRSPPSSINIAARRSKPRPAALGTTPRSNSYVGPRTLTHSPTINRSGANPLSPGKMRRIVSTASLNSLNSCVNMNGSRIQKSYPASAQRSPINLHGFSEADLFIEENVQSIKRPSVTGSISSSLHPPTPMSPHDMTHLQREMTASSSSSDDMNQMYNGAVGHGYFEDSNLASPPETPAFFGEMQTSHWSSFSIPDDPLHTPGHATFGTDIYMSMPSSQPNTPAYPAYLASAFNNNYGTPQYGLQNSCSTSHENLFPAGNSCYAPGFMKSSPDSSKEYLFQNQTPKDYETMTK